MIKKERISGTITSGFFLISLGIFGCIIFFVKCIDKQQNTRADNLSKNLKEFAGADKCLKCHKSIYDSFIQTAHHLTSLPATEQNIKGSLQPGTNAFSFNYNVKVVAEKRKDGVYQVEYINDVEKKARRFDITIGSGTRGQTYLYWWKDTLFQLPLTYLTAANQWCNSPGYAEHIAFGRPVTSRCLECHATFAQTISEPDEKIEKFDHHIIYGVDCEKCHGSGAEHVAYQTEHPNEKTGKFIINPAMFSRKQSLDLCSLCHGGRLQKTKPSFSFMPGDTLTNYFVVDSSILFSNTMDVHGNQYGLLASSKCFQNSNMTCLSCHNPHANETGNVKLFSARCMTCHNRKDGHDCKMYKELGPIIERNCINCHMPEQPSKAIVVMLQGQMQPTAAEMHTHLIKPYSDETKKFIKLFKETGTIN